MTKLVRLVYGAEALEGGSKFAGPQISAQDRAARFSRPQSGPWVRRPAFLQPAAQAAGARGARFSALLHPNGGKSSETTAPVRAGQRATRVSKGETTARARETRGGLLHFGRQRSLRKDGRERRNPEREWIPKPEKVSIPAAAGGPPPGRPGARKVRAGAPERQHLVVGVMCEHKHV